jgi:hypothetical protein
MQPSQGPRLAAALLVAGALAVAGCGNEPQPSPEVAGSGDVGRTGAPSTTGAPAPTTTEAPDGADTEAPLDAGAVRPAWLGTRPLPLGPDGYGEIQPTPPELVDRRLPPPPDQLAQPAGGGFASRIEEVPPEVAARSTWDPACPVGLGELRYLTVSFWGFDDRAHTGEMLVHAEVADDVVGVFKRLHQARFPIEEMRITRAEELDLHPTGDGNNTGAFVCRPSRGTTSWSEHAYGRAVDINPFHNPFVKGDLVLPELASAYVDRTAERPGMIVGDEAVTAAFAKIGWGWGGTWRSSKDYMHFSVTGR